MDMMQVHVDHRMKQLRREADVNRMAQDGRPERDGMGVRARPWRGLMRPLGEAVAVVFGAFVRQTR